MSKTCSRKCDSHAGFCGNFGPPSQCWTSPPTRCLAAFDLHLARNLTGSQQALSALGWRQPGLAGQFLMDLGMSIWVCPSGFVEWLVLYMFGRCQRVLRDQTKTTKHGFFEPGQACFPTGTGPQCSQTHLKNSALGCLLLRETHHRNTVVWCFGLMWFLLVQVPFEACWSLMWFRLSSRAQQKLHKLRNDIQRRTMDLLPSNTQWPIRRRLGATKAQLRFLLRKTRPEIGNNCLSVQRKAGVSLWRPCGEEQQLNVFSIVFVVHQLGGSSERAEAAGFALNHEFVSEFPDSVWGFSVHETGVNFPEIQFTVIRWPPNPGGVFLCNCDDRKPDMKAMNTGSWLYEFYDIYLLDPLLPGMLRTLKCHSGMSGKRPEWRRTVFMRWRCKTPLSWLRLPEPFCDCLEKVFSADDLNLVCTQ